MHIKNQQGFLYIVAIILITVISLILSAAVYQITINAKEASNSLNSSQAYYMAQSGINYAQHQFYVNAANCGQTFTGVGFTGSPGVFIATSNLSGLTCTITSTGYIPNTTSPVAIRTLQGTLVSYGIADAPVMAIGTVSMTGNANVTNLYVNSTSPHYAGSTINTSGTVSLVGSVSTIVNGLNPSSTTSSLKADIKQNNASLTQANLFRNYFTQTVAQIKSAATQIASESGITNVAGGTYYSNVPLTLAGNDNIGTLANPTILLVNGNLSIFGNTTVYGLIYVIGGTLSITGNATINGAVAAENGVSLVGNANIIFNTSVMNNAHQTNSNTTLHYNDALGGLQEIIP